MYSQSNKVSDNKVYFVSKCRVNIAKKQFSNVQNEYELMFERDTVIEPVLSLRGDELIVVC
jgi:replication factor A1